MAVPSVCRSAIDIVSSGWRWDRIPICALNWVQVALMNIIVAGLIGQYPIGGVTWDYIQYVLGLRDSGTT